MDFENGYGGFLSFDDEVCLFQAFDNEVPNDLPDFNPDEE